MNFLKSPPTALAAIALLAAAGIAQAQRQYDFQYRVTDPQIQVFDDGRITRLQIPEGNLLPTVIAIEPRGEVLLQPKREAPYLVIEGVYARLALRWSGRPDVVAVYAGEAAQRQGAPVAFASVAPVHTYGAVAAPQPVVAAQPKVAPQHLGAMPALSAPDWVIAPQDEWLSTALDRWALDAKTRLVWQLDEDFPLTHTQPRRYSGTFAQAMARALADADAALQASFNLAGTELTITKTTKTTQKGTP